MHAGWFCSLKLVTLFSGRAALDFARAGSPELVSGLGKPEAGMDCQAVRLSGCQANNKNKLHFWLAAISDTGRAGELGNKQERETDRFAATSVGAVQPRALGRIDLAANNLTLSLPCIPQYFPYQLTINVPIVHPILSPPTHIYPGDLHYHQPYRRLSLGISFVELRPPALRGPTSAAPTA